MLDEFLVPEPCLCPFGSGHYYWFNTASGPTFVPTRSILIHAIFCKLRDGIPSPHLTHASSREYRTREKAVADYESVMKNET